METTDRTPGHPKRRSIIASRHTNITNRQIQSGTVTVSTTASTIGLDGRGAAKLTYAIDATAFQEVGSGLSDITPVITSFNVPIARAYRVVINTAGGTDTFDWYWQALRGPGLDTMPAKSGWSLGALAVSMTGGAMTLNQGVTIEWNAATGHTAADEWRFIARRPAIDPQILVVHYQNLDATLKISIAPTLAVTRDATASGGWVLGPEEVMSLNWPAGDINRLVFIGTANTIMRIWEEGIG